MRFYRGIMIDGSTIHFSGTRYDVGDPGKVEAKIDSLLAPEQYNGKNIRSIMSKNVND